MFRRLGLPCLLGVTFLVGACKSQSPEAAAAVPPATPTAATPTATAPAAAAPAAPTPAAITDDSLSFVQKAGEGCEWFRIDAIANRRTKVMSFPAPCEGLQFAWSQDGRMAALLRRAEGAPTHLWLVESGKGTGTEVPLPDVGTTAGLGFDAQGRLVALMAHPEAAPGEAQPAAKPPTRVKEKGKAFFSFEGQKYAVDEEGGVPGLAHAYRREGNAWKHVETKASTFSGEGSAEVNALEIVKQLGPTSLSNGGPRPEQVSDAKQKELEKAIPAGANADGERTWAKLDTVGGPVYAAAEYVEGSILTRAPLRWEVGGKPVEPAQLKLPDGADVTLSLRGALLLVSAEQSARLYDVEHKKNLLSLDGASYALFWPTAGAKAAAAGTESSSLSMKLDTADAAFEFLSKSKMDLKEGKEDCASLTANGTLGALVTKSRTIATDWTAWCEPDAAHKRWACKAEFSRTGKDDQPDFLLHLQYTVDDATRALVPGSLICRKTV